jgi:ABC-type sugar transport system permease subunit
MLLPALAALTFYLYYPIEETFRLSLMRATGLGQPVFAGLENYRRLFVNEEFLNGLLHIFQWAFFSVLIQIPLAFFIGFSLVSFRNRLTGTLRAVFYLANVLPSAITALIGRFVFSPLPSGALATLASRIGWKWLASIDFFGNPDLAFWTVFAVATWTYTGFPIVYLMARIEQIPGELREAAEIDGANRWQYATRIVVPVVSYPLRILAVLATVGSFKLFDLPYLLTRGGPGYATVTLGITLYQQGFVNWQYGRAAAIGVVIFLLSLAFTVTQFAWQRRESQS